MNTPAWITALVSGGGVSAFLTYLGGRHHGRADFLNATAKAADMVANRLQAECERVHNRCAALEARDERCQEDLAKVKDELAEVRRRTTAQIDALMNGPVAPYRLDPT